eukprot:359886-Ditylum_brightwellii.AAC.1
MPLHAACQNGASSDVVSSLLSIWPEAVNEQAICGRTPIQKACRNQASFEVMTLLLNAWLGCKENRSNSAVAHFAEFASRDYFGLRRRRRRTERLISQLSALCNSNTDNPSPNEILNFFVRIELWNGITFVLDKHPIVVKAIDLDTNVMADFLSTVGRCCRLTTMWKILCNKQDLIQGV